MELTSMFIHARKILLGIIEYVTTGRIYQNEFSISMKFRDHFDIYGRYFEIAQMVIEGDLSHD